jgi:hypothetical protein
MSFSLPARRYFARGGPRASQLAIPGSVVSLPVTAGASYINLQALFAQVPTQNNYSNFSDEINGVQGQGIVLQAVTATVGLIVGKAVGDVTGANAPVLATQGTLTAGVYTPVAGTCWQLAPGATIEFEPALTQDFFLGFVGSGSGSLLLFQCSLSNA